MCILASSKCDVKVSQIEIWCLTLESVISEPQVRERPPARKSIIQCAISVKFGRHRQSISSTNFQVRATNDLIRPWFACAWFPKSLYNRSVGGGSEQSPPTVSSMRSKQHPSKTREDKKTDHIRPRWTAKRDLIGTPKSGIVSIEDFQLKTKMKMAFLDRLLNLNL